MVKKTSAVQYYDAVGRRKEASARVRLHIVTKGKDILYKGAKLKAGDLLVNGAPLEKFAPHAYNAYEVMRPLVLTENQERFAITIHTIGGGIRGQIEAIRHGLARALCEVDAIAYRPVLKSNGLLTRDPRARQRRMVGTGGKSRRAKQSPKR